MDLHAQLRNTATQESVAFGARNVAQVHHYALIGLNVRAGNLAKTSTFFHGHSNLEGPTW